MGIKRQGPGERKSRSDSTLLSQSYPRSTYKDRAVNCPKKSCQQTLQKERIKGNLPRHVLGHKSPAQGQHVGLQENYSPRKRKGLKRAVFLMKELCVPLLF